MHFITEQEIQQKHRQTPMETFYVGAESRLTPGARQYLLDHQIKILSGKETDAASTSNLGDTRLAEATLQATFQLLTLELQAAGLKAQAIDLKVAQRIFKLAELPAAIEQEELKGFEEESECDWSQLTTADLVTPQGKILIKLQRSQVYAQLLMARVTDKQRQQVTHLIQLIEREKEQLIGANE
ncbi:hypothetical protein [Enterococcus asini]|uniref:hypothetical protein n=1 Tax=Enterococcus asini TaxID=57732 RepID=UPI000E512B96|nr:hypothetical protein [Enterococcus asini]RGW15363.1 hypothetical protein DWV91_02035 [Enterococcus asini]